MANIYCENYDCKNYFEDMCMLQRIEINNLKACESYVEGKKWAIPIRNEFGEDYRARIIEIIKLNLLII